MVLDPRLELNIKSTGLSFSYNSIFFKQGVGLLEMKYSHDMIAICLARATAGLTIDVAKLLVDGTLTDIRTLASNLDHIRRLLFVQLAHFLTLRNLRLCERRA